MSETNFEKLVDNLDESLSGSDDTESDSDSSDDDKKYNPTMLSALLKRQANISDPQIEEFAGTRKRKRGSGKPPMVWFSSPKLPTNTSLGIWRAIFTDAEQEAGDEQILSHLHTKQLTPKPAHNPSKDLAEGGVALPNTNTGPHVFMCMIGGGHFAAMVVSLAPKPTKQGNPNDRQATVLAHKTFHRYTTRRKQGGSQSTMDSAKGNASSAGSSLRRYNEDALIKDVRSLLAEWKTLIDTAELVFVRAAGSSSRRTLFGPYDGQVLRQADPRNRTFPFSTRRATQAELMRCFVELTRVKVETIDEAALAAAAAAEAQAEQNKAAAKQQQQQQKPVKPTLSKEDETAALHTSQVEALVRRAKAPALLTYLTTNSLSPDFALFPPDTQAHHHAPRALHLAAAAGQPALVTALLVRGGADPTLRNGEGRTAFELAGDRATRDAFRLARGELGEDKWVWGDKGARVPEALSKADVEQRAAAEREEEKAAEAARRREGMEKLKDEEQRRASAKTQAADDKREKKMGKGHLLNAGRERTAEERREEDARGMTPEMRARLERERRARAMEARMKG